jgi:hypothetical protein
LLLPVILATGEVDIRKFQGSQDPISTNKKLDVVGTRHPRYPGSINRRIMVQSSRA